MSAAQHIYARACSRQLSSAQWYTSFNVAAQQPRHRSGIPRLVCRALRSHSNLSSHSPSLRRSRFRRILSFGAISIFFTSAGFLIASAPAISSIMALVSAPSDSESLQMYKAPDDMAAEIERHIHNHPLALALRARSKWTESKPHLRYPEGHKKHSLTAGTLLGPGKFPVPPTVFCDEKDLVSLSYAGTDMCGHVGIIHGGLLATMLDEGLGRLAFNSLPNKIGVTASLTVNYRKPAPAGSYLVLKGETTKVEGRKVWVKGRIELLGDDETPGQLLAEAEGLFIEPKYAKVSLAFTEGLKKFH